VRAAEGSSFINLRTMLVALRPVFRRNSTCSVPAIVSQEQYRAGDAVRIRGERWRIASASSLDDVAIIEVEGCDATNLGERARFIRAFERIDRIGTRSAVPRVVSLERWRRAARAILANTVPDWTSLRAAARADLTILPFQLEPAMAVTRGVACRILIADEVGLGKTIQAGLIIAETLVRTPDGRVLVVSPAGLRDQWRAELHTRFRVTAEILDAEGIARAAAHVGQAVNPWSFQPVAITSIDYVKRPEVMRSLETLTWDVIVFDEAHALAGRSDRAVAASALARRARTVVMLTATPHSGDEDAFARLRSLGDLDTSYPLMTFHRTRRSVGLPHGRRTVQLRIGPTDGENQVHSSLAVYVARLTEESAPAGGLVASILMRRACSSAFALARSVERRIALLADAPMATGNQLSLPFVDADTDDEPGAELGAAGLRDAGEEMRHLEHLLGLCRVAAEHESKVEALKRLIRRADEPVLVFTEYRDTLWHLAGELSAFAPTQLHGGLSARERLEVLHRFSSGATRVLLATDAASEGLNLHQRCRLAVNLELPWTPMRLEQRIGRVDRFGQARRVHAVQLIARSTAEELLAMDLDERMTRIEAALQPQVTSPLRDAAEVEATRLRLSRLLAQTPNQPSANRPLFTFVRRPPPEAIWIFQHSCVDSGGRHVFETVGALCDSRQRTGIDAGLLSAVVRDQERLVASTCAQVTPWLDLTLRRERSMLQALRQSHARLSASLLQPGLFDRRAERAAATQCARVEEAVERSRARELALERLRCLRADASAILLGITFRA
jgi:superfamily II DNA or RNA helicase